MEVISHVKKEGGDGRSWGELSITDREENFHAYRARIIHGRGQKVLEPSPLVSRVLRVFDPCKGVYPCTVVVPIKQPVAFGL